MMGLKNYVYYVLSCMTVGTYCQVLGPTQLQVYTYEHLFHLTGSTRGTGAHVRDTLLVMYTPECRPEVDKLPLFDDVLPHEPIMTTVLHDWKTFPARIWYNLPVSDRLSQSFTPRACPSVYFLPKGQQTDGGARYWDAEKDGDLVAWVWAQMTRTVTIRNTCDVYVEVTYLQNNGRDNSTTLIPPGKLEEKKLYRSDRLIAVDATQGFFLKGRVVERNDDVTITCPGLRGSGKDGEREDYMFGDCDDLSGVPTLHLYLSCALFVESQSLSDQITLTANFLQNLKNPLVVPSFTPEGYQILSVPSILYDSLLKFYKENRFRAEPEDLHMSHLVNYRDVSSKYIHLPQYLKQDLSKKMHMMLEEWSNTSLVYTSAYGVKEYHRGNILKNHVESLDTGHAISVIVQVDKDLDSASDWPLEIIDLKGKKHQIYLKPGEMLLYESSKVIHGRPQPFQGHVDAQAYFRFRPTGWEDIFGTNKGRVSDLKLKYGFGEEENLFPLESPLTDKLAENEALPSATPYSVYNEWSFQRKRKEEL